VTTLDVQVVPPPFFCPVPAALHPAVEQIEAAATQWLDKVCLHRDLPERAQLIGTNSAEFYARFAPHGDSSGVLTAASWVYWGFAFDDSRCDSGPYSADPPAFLALAGHVQRAIESAEPPAEAYGAALHDIVRTMRTQVSETVVRRFTEAHRHWLYCVAWQIGNRAAGRMPAVPEYLTMRLGSAGGPPTIALLEVANGIEVPSAEMDSPAVRALTEMTQLVASLDNDLHSYRRETVKNQTDQNIVNVLRHHDGLDLEAAVTAAVGLRDRVMLRLLELRDEVRDGASEELRIYLDGLGHSIRGNIDWAARVPRYADADGPLHVTTCDEPHESTRDPLPFPVVSWWWDRLAG
jgi:hypothetical protein